MTRAGPDSWVCNTEDMQHLSPCSQLFCMVAQSLLNVLLAMSTARSNIYDHCIGVHVHVAPVHSVVLYSFCAKLPSKRFKTRFCGVSGS